MPSSRTRLSVCLTTAPSTAHESQTIDLLHERINCLDEKPQLAVLARLIQTRWLRVCSQKALLSKR